MFSLSFARPSFAQSQTQQYVYANVPGSPASTSTLPAYSKSGQVGSLSPISGSPFPDHLEGGRIAVDALGRFLFVLNASTSGISMFQIDSSTGALTEVPDSPFSAGKTINPNQAPSSPISVATEKSGKYLYVGYTGGNLANFSAITPFVIDAANRQLTLTDQLSFDVTYNPLQMFSDPRGLFLYVLNGMNPFTQLPNGGASVFSIAASDGSLALNGSAGGGSDSRSIASDPQGRFFFEGSGQLAGSLFWGSISPLDGTSDPNQQILPLGENNFPIAMVVDSSGKFLYMQQSSGLVIYSIDQTTGQPTPLTAPLPSPVFQLGNVVADPAGAFLYAGSSAGVRAFQVNAQNGSLLEIPGSPFAAGGIPGNIAISGTSIQAISGPSAAFDKSSLNFGFVTQGHPVTFVLHLVNNGDQALAINLPATIAGANASDFSQTSTCAATLGPNANCSFSVNFSPSTTKMESASLQIADNAPGSPQRISLSGTGVAAIPSLAFVPGSVVFNPIAQGVTEAPQPIQVTNIGSAILHITNVSLGGANPGDFSQSNNCTAAPIAVNASCTINASFTPLATGMRSASVTLTDDAPNSPQTLSIGGTGAIAFQISRSPQSSTSATVTAGQTAQYALQLNPGTGFNGSISMTCTGAPLAATCALSSDTLNVNSSNPVAFNVSVKTSSGTSAVSPVREIPPSEWPNTPPPLAPSLLLLFLCVVNRLNRNQRRPVAIYAAFALTLLVASISGCGGASNAITPPLQQTATPKGTYTVTVTAAANHLPAQTISLTLTVN